MGIKTVDTTTLTADEVRAACGAINDFGDASHPFPEPATLGGFGLDYVVRCLRDLLRAPCERSPRYREAAKSALAKLAPSSAIEWTPAIATGSRDTKRVATAIAALTFTPDGRRRLSYVISDGPQAGLTFHAYDTPTPGTTCRITYHPDDQFARSIPTLDEARTAAQDAVQLIADALFVAAGCKDGMRTQPMPACTSAVSAAVLEAVASFLSCIASEDLRAANYVTMVDTLSGLASNCACALGMDPVQVGEPVANFVTRLAAEEG